MSSSVNPLGSRLVGKTIFLSGSVPAPRRAEQYLRVEDAAFEIEQAVISLGRAVFSEGGELVFGGHPAISPLVAMVAGEYREPRYAESSKEKPRAPIRIFQSRAFEGFLPDDTLLMYQLGYATITWVDAANGEKFDPNMQYDYPPCPNSLRAMREAMIGSTRPEAMVCIGGMEGVEKEAEIFRALRRSAPIYVLERTGGASLILARRLNDVRVIDTETLNRIEHLKTEFPRKTPERIGRQQEQRAVVPYPLVMQTIVDELAHRSGDKGSDRSR
jgi:SLOG cluster3 family